MELVKILEAFTPGSVGIWTGVLMFAAWLLKEWRETRKLSAEDRLARREGYSKQVELLTQENRLLIEGQRRLREEYDHYRRLCHQENDELRTLYRTETESLRNLIIRLEGEIAGYKRRLDNQAQELMALKGRVEAGDEC